MTRDQAKPLLNYISNHVNLSDSEEDELIAIINYRKYLKGQYLVQQGDICKHSSFIISGCARTFFVDDKGQEHTIMFAIEDWWTSDIGSLITQSPADYNVQCIEDTEVIQFPYDIQEALYLKIPKLERLFRKMLERAFVASQKRIVRSFSLTAKEQYIHFKKQYPKIEQRIPQYMVASYLGITKEFLSKIKSQLATE
ncbi:Crp/Fnr family transcriptional regulator [Seonamhaeicola marinus]|uniref:Crp/Fnr family transcriptional regulator n=1 Tax=Seonamhaeicola marinus TaxID=1912246 RepID=A0A5D0HNI7_9FLAO|nr:Crp/Fnr family transcriptional regulator [Seonamhaeicola marinus]TYA71637.1 Crp/Fnr family transcriptional regulator [Seonamhaeicola marinus]